MKFINNINMDNKKRRAANFTTTEVDCLMKCVMPELNIIENKKIDTATVREKQNAWLRVTDRFNSICGENIYRDVNSIKIKYENIKKILKKKVFANNEPGLPPAEIKWLWFEKELFAILQLGVESLEPTGDNFAEITSQASNEQSYTTEVLIERDDATNGVQVCNDTVRIDDTEVRKEKSEESESNACTSFNGTHSENKKDIVGIINPLSVNGSNEFRYKRKRASVGYSAEQSNANIDSLNELRKSKTELIEIQKRCAQVELQLKTNECRQNAERWKLEEKILSKTLDELDEESKRKKQLFELTLEKEKLTIERMKFELNETVKKGVHD